MDRRVLGCSKKKELVKTEPKKIAKIDIERGLTQATDPKIKQRCVTQDAVK